MIINHYDYEYAKCSYSIKNHIPHFLCELELASFSSICSAFGIRLLSSTGQILRARCPWFYHNNDDSYGIVQAVVKANSQSNGNGKFLPWGSETDERILMKLGIYNHVVGMTQIHPNPCGASTTWVVWAKT